MRKSLALYAAVLTSVLAATTAIVQISSFDAVGRHHQHLSSPSEADLGGVCARCGEDEFYTHLPLVMVDTGGQEIPGRAEGFDEIYCRAEQIETNDYGQEPQIEVRVTVIDNDGDWNAVSDEPAITSDALMRVRGNSSRMFDKLSYRLDLIDGFDEYGWQINRPMPLLGMQSHSQWAMHGPFLDKTLMRNYVSMNIAAYVMGPGQWVPDVRFFELFIDGQFQGLYVLMETIAVDPGRLDLTAFEPGMPLSSYVFQLGTADPRDSRLVETFSQATLRLEPERQWALMYPGRRRVTPEARHYATMSLSTLERQLYSPDFILRPGAINGYIDLDSFVNFFVLYEFLGVIDLGSESTFIHKDARGRVTAGPVWDFNNVLNNFLLDIDYDRLLLADSWWVARLLTNPIFTSRAVARYDELRRGVLSDEHLTGYIADVQAWLGSAVDRNFEVWGYTFDPSQVSPCARRGPTPEQRAE
jgi:hypothetical protein